MATGRSKKFIHNTFSLGIGRHKKAGTMPPTTNFAPDTHKIVRNIHANRVGMLGYDGA